MAATSFSSFTFSEMCVWILRSLDWARSPSAESVVGKQLGAKRGVTMGASRSPVESCCWQCAMEARVFVRVCSVDSSR